MTQTQQREQLSFEGRPVESMEVTLGSTKMSVSEQLKVGDKVEVTIIAVVSAVNFPGPKEAPDDEMFPNVKRVHLLTGLDGRLRKL
jgi:hypothetical protein